MPDGPPALVILDRDGVINRDSADYIKSPDEWISYPSSIAAIARLIAAGLEVVVATNQSGIARGLFDAATLEAIHAKMIAEVEAAGGRLAGIYVCPHAPEDACACRKPAPGLLRAIEADLRCSLEGVPVIGDKQADLLAAQAVRARPMLVLTGHGRTLSSNAAIEGVEVFEDLSAAVDALLLERTGRA